MNKKLIGLLVPVLGGIAIVGSGFSAWHFEEDLTVTESIMENLEGTVTGLTQKGTLELGTQTVTVTLDQNSNIYASDYEEKGIEIAEEDPENDTFNFTFKANDDFIRENAENEWGYTGYEVAVSFAENDTIDEYVDVIVEDGGNITDNFIEIPEFDVNGEIPSVEATGNLSLVWDANQKPTTYDEYIDMLNTLSGAETFDETNAMDGLTDPFTFTITVSVTPVM